MASKEHNKPNTKGKRGNNKPPAGHKKRKWVAEHKLFQGSVAEGQGFAFRRKQKVQHEYNKLLRKERKNKPAAQAMYKEEYPEHLKHLYMAEAEKLKHEAWENRLKRSRSRVIAPEAGDAQSEDTDDVRVAQTASADPESADVMQQPDAEPVAAESTVAERPNSLPMSNRMKKKLLKKTSYQKTKEEYENIREKRRKKKEDYLKNKEQKQEAIQKYQEKKKAKYEMLKKKTKKGQPNLNLHMEYLLQKIQGDGK